MLHFASPTTRHAHRNSSLKCPAGNLYGEEWLLAYCKPAALFSTAGAMMALLEAAQSRTTLHQQMALTMRFWGLVCAGISCFVVAVFYSTLPDVHSKWVCLLLLARRVWPM
ncbi:MAG: hypothetical protein HC767_11570 [Akkermansiaceae bacterium]|nr:hypothetical protein [Akkermansiaceae bacterium]